MMETPYTIEELDTLMKACVSFTNQHEPYFMTGNISGRDGVRADIDSVRRMMDWVVETDKGLLEYCGLGQDNVPYFRLGHDANRIVGNGGFKKYLHDRKLKERLEQVRIWAPICISLLAAIVSIFAWLAPKDSSSRIDELTTQVNRLQTDQEQTKAIVTIVRGNLDTMSSQLPTKPPTSR